MNKQVRLTRQKKAVLDEMKKFQRAHLHPTADEVYRSIKKKMPKISLATVYRNLERLAEQGLISEIKFPDAPTHYNGNSKLHHHIRCISCGRVDDVSKRPFIKIKNSVSKISGYKVTGYQLELFGLCPNCKKKIKNLLNKKEVSCGKPKGNKNRKKFINSVCR